MTKIIFAVLFALALQACAGGEVSSYLKARDARDAQLVEENKQLTTTNAALTKAIADADADTAKANGQPSAPQRANPNPALAGQPYYYPPQRPTTATSTSPRAAMIATMLAENVLEIPPDPRLCANPSPLPNVFYLEGSPQVTKGGDEMIAIRPWKFNKDIRPFVSFKVGGKMAAICDGFTPLLQVADLPDRNGAIVRGVAYVGPNDRRAFHVAFTLESFATSSIHTIEVLTSERRVTIDPASMLPFPLFVGVTKGQRTIDASGDMQGISLVAFGPYDHIGHSHQTY